MTRVTPAREAGIRRQPVSADRVTCSRLGPVGLDRCRECDYLLRLERAGASDSATAYVVCRDRDLESEVDFAW
jgi:hypothetical protein